MSGFTGQFRVGQWLSCCLPYSGRGAIYRIDGEQSPETCQKIGPVGVTGGRAYLGVVFENGHKSSIPESLARGSVQWEVYDEYASPEEIADMLKAVDEKEAADKAQRAAEAQAKAEEAQRITRENTHLEKAAGSKKTLWALGSANIRRELAAAFPGHKFSVTSDSYSGGCSINIHWTDGPSTPEVKAITEKYQKCHFDGMQDLEELTGSVWADIFGGASYVFEQRTVSESNYAAIAAEMGIQWPTNNYSDSEPVFREAHGRSYYVKPQTAVVPQAPAVPADGKPSVTENLDKGGIEIRFPAKPDAAVLERLKAAGWRWSRFSGCWYTKASDSARSFAAAVVA